MSFQGISGAGTPRRAGRSPRPCGVRGHVAEGGGGGVLVADGPLGVRRIGGLLRCSHLVAPLCIAVSPVGARLTAVWGAALFPVALLRALLPIWCSFFLRWRTRGCWCALRGGQRVAPCLPGCPQGKKGGVRNANRNERSRGRSLLHGQDTGKTWARHGEDTIPQKRY